MHNPLRQHFRRPSIYLKLPSEGRYYPPEAIDLPENKEIPIYPMTAIDEITSKTPDALFNGIAVVEIIKSCAPNIKDPWSIPAIDLDAVLIAIKAASGGSELDIESECPKCNHKSDYSINTAGLLANISKPNYEVPIEINELIVRFNPLSYKTVNKINLLQFELEKKLKNVSEIEDKDVRSNSMTSAIKELADIGIELITETIQSITTNVVSVTEKHHINEFLKNCDKQTYETIRQTVINLRQDSELKPLRIKCGNCSHEYEQSLAFNITDFFG